MNLNWAQNDEKVGYPGRKWDQNELKLGSPQFGIVLCKIYMEPVCCFSRTMIETTDMFYVNCLEYIFKLR